MSANPVSNSVLPPPEVLKPDLSLLRKEYVLVQAWKKTASYIRRHNWYSDPLELDWTTIELQDFLGRLSDALTNPHNWTSDDLRLVPAPKSQEWIVKGKKWKPTPRVGFQEIRPLAHASIRDQVVATALLLCLADRVETAQLDPASDPQDKTADELTSSYGNRLFCDANGGELRHRWGSSTLYRSFFADYRVFVRRPTVYGDTQIRGTSGRHFLVAADLKQFYDRVRPEHLHAALRRLQKEGDDPNFFDFATRVLSWRWHCDDLSTVDAYAHANEIDDLRTVALPQGLVAAGFLANVVLLGFDAAMRKRIGESLGSSIVLRQYFRYVDDLRVIVSCREEIDPEVVRDKVVDVLDETLGGECSFLCLSRSERKKPTVAEIGGKRLPLVLQSARMKRIQAAVSGGFGAVEGAQILSSVFALVRSQQALSPRARQSRKQEDATWALRPVPDVRDDTARRFAAGRFRVTFRSVRPLLHASDTGDIVDVAGGRQRTPTDRVSLTQGDLDAEAKMFTLHLIGLWTADPSQIRLLRIGLDIWPDGDVLKEVLTLLCPIVSQNPGERSPRQLVGCYCLAELFRAGATETGFVGDEEALPKGVKPDIYRKRLADEAERLLSFRAAVVPWYLRHQAVLFLAVFRHEALYELPPDWVGDADRHQSIVNYFRGMSPSHPGDHAAVAIWLRRALARPVAEHFRRGQSETTRREIARRDPSFARELVRDDPSFASGLSRQVLAETGAPLDWKTTRSLAARVCGELSDPAALRDELGLLRFSLSFLRHIEGEVPTVIAPHQVILDAGSEKHLVVHEILYAGDTLPADSRYRPPDWCPIERRWRFQLGFLLRFILTRNPDFTQTLFRRTSTATWPRYRPVRSHWYQRLYGSYNRRDAFGGDWIPITDWFEGFLRALLRWPGAAVERKFRWVDRSRKDVISKVESRIEELERMRGVNTETLLLPVPMRIPRGGGGRRGLNICVAQTTFPNFDTFESEDDWTLSEHEVRRYHRNHLSSALAAVKSAIDFQRTARPCGAPLDLLILPELAVHPDDVWRHLERFVFAYRVTVLAGVTYEDLCDTGSVVNSALWVVPEDSADGKARTRRYQQGKGHLSPEESEAPVRKGKKIMGFRPCQWILEYPVWGERKMRLTAAVCYDATDLGLACDLRVRTDALLVPALNRNVALFDNLAETLNYHMYQMLVVANNGVYGGSSAYWPSSDRHHRRIFHLHGGRQTSVAFVHIEYERLRTFLNRPGEECPERPEEKSMERPEEKFQPPPAGWKSGQEGKDGR